MQILLCLLTFEETPKEKTEFEATCTGSVYPIKDCISCNNKGAVYVLECSCKLQYVGRTKRALKVWNQTHTKYYQRIS